MKKQTQKQHRQLLFMKFVNSLLAGGLVLFGACSNGPLTWEAIGLAAGASILAVITQFKEYVNQEITQHSSIKLFTFVGG